MIYKYSSVFSSIINQSKKKSISDPVVQHYREGKLEYFTYSEMFKKIILFNKALVEKGIALGDRVGIVSENRIEWLIADLATNSIGIINVPTFPNFTPSEQKYIFSNCNAKVIIVSNQLQLKNILSIRDELENLKFIIVMNEGLEDEENNIYSFNKLIESAENDNYEKIKSEFFEKSEKVNLDDILTIIYTSGTTGNPKGVVLTNRNMVSNLDSIISTNIINDSDTFLSFLPMCHAYERIVIYTFLSIGGLVTIAQSIDTLSKNINDVKPTIITAVPKLLETVRTKIYKEIENENTAKKHIALSALSLADKFVEEKKIHILDKWKLKLYDKLIFSKIRAKLGGNLNYIVSGGAALSSLVHRFFLSIGIPVIQGFGLTECSPVVSANLPTNLEVGTVGPPLKNVEVKIASNGEILVRGDLVMKGYWKDEIATKSCIDDNGWFHTGDIGEFTKNGSLKITGRIKNIIITNGGKNISPAPIENLIRMSDVIEYIAIYGNDKEYLTALISPNFDQLNLLAERSGIKFNSISELVNNPIIKKFVKNDIDKYQSSLAKYERVRKFVILENPFTVETGELTPKLSMKTNIIFEKYKNEIDRMYS